MALDVSFVPLVPRVWLAALALGVLLLAVPGYWRGLRGTTLRVLAALALGLALANPVLDQRQSEPLDDILFVVTDTSASQSLDGRADRARAMRAMLARKLETVPGLDVRYIGAGRTGGGTNLFGALEAAMGEVPPERVAGAIFITDGQVHDVPGRAARLGFRAPVHALITGRKSERDRRMLVRRSPRFGILGKPLSISFRVEDPSAEAGEQARVTIRINGRKQREQMQTVNRDVILPFRLARRGENIIELEVAAAPGELTTRNNRAVVATVGIRDRLRVLLVSGEPHAGERTWRQLLKSDTSVDLVHFTILRPPEKQDDTPINELSLIAFPTRELFVEKLKEFDLIIFDRYYRRGVLPLLYLENVADYVRGGGAILVAAGPAYATPLSLFRTPLSGILPAVPTGKVIEQPYRPQLTPLGLRHPVTRALPDAGNGGAPRWGRWFRIIEGDDSGRSGKTLMSGAGARPLLVLSREGKGRVALLLSDHAWLWTRGFEGGGPQAELLRRLAHWLMKEPDLEEEALKATFRDDRLVVERRSLLDSVPDVAITPPSGRTVLKTLQNAAPGLWKTVLPTTEQGFFRIRNGDLTAVAASGARPGKEYAEVRATGKKLEKLVGTTGGGIFWPVSAGPGKTKITLPALRHLSTRARMAGPGWLAIQKNGAEKLLAERRLPLLSGLVGIALVLLTLVAAWRREGR